MEVLVSHRWSATGRSWTDSRGGPGPGSWREWRSRPARWLRPGRMSDDARGELPPARRRRPVGEIPQ